MSQTDAGGGREQPCSPFTSAAQRAYVATWLPPFLAILATAILMWRATSAPAQLVPRFVAAIATVVGAAALSVTLALRHRHQLALQFFSLAILAVILVSPHYLYTTVTSVHLVVIPLAATAILLFAGTLFNGRTMVLACTVSLAALVVMPLRWPNDTGGEQPALIAVSYFAAIVAVLLWSRLSSRLIARATGEAALARKSRAHAHALVENQKVLNQELEHRVKNNLQMLISIINLELDKLPPGQTRAALLATQTRVQAIALLHEILFGPIYGSRKGLVPYFEALAAHVISAYSDVEVGLEVELSVSDVQPDPDTLLPLAIVVNELLTNAVVHGALTAGERRVGLRMYRSDRGTPEDTFFVTEIWDRGPGFSGEFDSADAKTLGLNLVASLVESLGGSFEIRNEAPGARAVVVISCSRLSTAWAVPNDADG